jgi:hypothetical protein
MANEFVPQPGAADQLTMLICDLIPEEAPVDAVLEALERVIALAIVESLPTAGLRINRINASHQRLLELVRRAAVEEADAGAAG